MGWLGKVNAVPSSAGDAVELKLGVEVGSGVNVAVVVGEGVNVRVRCLVMVGGWSDAGRNAHNLLDGRFRHSGRWWLGARGENSYKYHTE